MGQPNGVGRGPPEVVERRRGRIGETDQEGPDRLAQRPVRDPHHQAGLDGRVVEEGGLLLVRLVASHFLWKMVRRLVGTLVRVGWGELPVESLRALLAGSAGTGAAPAEWTAPASGLFLERVLYRGDSPLAAPRAVTPLLLLRD